MTVPKDASTAEERAAAFDDWAANSLARFYARQVERVAARLRELADVVERDGHARSPIHYTTAAANVVHDIQSCIANLPLDTLILAAGDAQAGVPS